MVYLAVVSWGRSETGKCHMTGGMQFMSVRARPCMYDERQDAYVLLVSFPDSPRPTYFLCGWDRESLGTRLSVRLFLKP